MNRRFDYPLNPVSLQNCRITGGFWHEKMEINRMVTLPAMFHRYKKSPYPGTKWLEATAYHLATCPDRTAARRIEAAIKAIGCLQAKDGFIGPQKPGERWNNLRGSHRLYGQGHLIEAAVAYYEATGKRILLDMVCRSIDYIASVFGPDRKQIHGYPGHQEIELALVKLYRVTGRQRYLDLAKYFLDERGKQPHIFDIEARARGEKPEDFYYKTYQYNQSHLPVREQKDAVGHAVRATYMFCAMTDVAVLTNDKSLMNAAKRLWRSVTRRRMAVTGGVGPLRANEGFTTDYDLPGEGAYLETCAAIGLLLWAQRLLQAEKDAQYAGIVERTLYNHILCGVSADGKSFFYGSPLAVHPGFDGDGKYAGEGYHYRRSEWFDCPCCPPNVARLIALMPALICSHAKNAVYIHQYIPSTTQLTVSGQTVVLTQKTDYPWNGRIRLNVKPVRPASWTLALRIPGWCTRAILKINGKAVNAAKITNKGYACIKREWSAGDTVTLELAMPVERIEAHPAARQTAGCIALQRGPVVYCLEQADNGPGLAAINLPRNAKLSTRRDSRLPGKPVVITAKALKRSSTGWNTALYRPAGSSMKPVSITAIPFYLWGNRASGEMRVWIHDQPASGRKKK
jgi:DUF1680 family protein